MRSGNHEKGVALMLVLILLAAAVILGVAYISQASLNAAMASGHASSSRARYLAESGIQHAVCLLRENPALLAGSGATPLGPFKLEGADGAEAYTLSVTSVGADQYTVRATANSGRSTQTATANVALTSQYAALVMADKPVGYWRLGEDHGRAAVDSAGSNNGKYANGVDLGQTGALAGDVDTAARFDGRNDHITLGEPDLSGTGMAIVAWVRADQALRREGAVLSKATGDALSQQYWSLGVSRLDQHELRLRYAVKLKGASVAVNTRTPGDWLGKWILVAAVYDQRRLTVYVDGIAVGSRLATGPISKNRRVHAWIGGCPADARSKPWAGLLDEVALFDRPLTGAQVQELHAARSPKVSIVHWEN